MKRSFIDDDFLLSTDSARRLYFEYACEEPIVDYHSHLSPKEVADDRSFGNLYEIWLAGDHYKWRAMRANGVEERYCTGDASDYEKFLAWARTVPKTLRNPLYHWTHLELKRFFGIDELLDEESAPRIWERANERLASLEMSAQGILRRCKVEVLCTTDDPADSLEHHRRFGEGESDLKLFPTFRPDRFIAIDRPRFFNRAVDELEERSGIVCDEFDRFLEALEGRHDEFASIGCRLSDHGLERLPDRDCTEAKARTIYETIRMGGEVIAEEVERFQTFMMLFFGRLDAARGWTKQLHIGALRNNNTRFFDVLGPDTGFDSISDEPQARALGRYLDRLDRSDELPKTILYNLNPAQNYIFGTMIGNFQDGRVAGKMQLGSGWWHLDQKEGIEWQLNALSNLGLLSRFVGMLTDSRSFLSFSRHEYFRRILCNLIGREIESGELPNDFDLLGELVRDISYRNARDFFGFM